MRTTLDIDDDLLAAAREIARREHQSLGTVISRLARQTLSGSADGAVDAAEAPEAVAGFRPFPSRGAPVTNETIDRVRDAEGT